MVFYGLIFVGFGSPISRLSSSHLKSRYVYLPFIIARLDDREKMIVQTRDDRSGDCRFQSDILPLRQILRIGFMRKAHRSYPLAWVHDEKVRREQSERPTPLSTLYFCHFENKRERRDRVGTGDPYVIPCQKDIRHLPTRGGTNEVI